MRDKMIADGRDPTFAKETAAHLSNRYAGSIPQESVSRLGRQLGNLEMFSRSFTSGNIGVMKDTVMGLPADAQARIARDGGFEELAKIKSVARRKALHAFMIDAAIFYGLNSLLQDAANAYHDYDKEDADKNAWQKTKSLVGKTADGYARRFNALIGQIQENPLVALNPFFLGNRLSATFDNEPGKQDRVFLGTLSDGTGLYLRNPFGKIGEEFIGYVTEPLAMFARKESTLFRPIMQTLANRTGFKNDLYNRHAETMGEYADNASLP